MFLQVIFCNTNLIEITLPFPIAAMNNRINLILFDITPVVKLPDYKRVINKLASLNYFEPVLLTHHRLSLVLTNHLITINRNDESFAQRLSFFEEFDMPPMKHIENTNYIYIFISHFLLPLFLCYR